MKTEKTLKFNSESVDADSIIIPNNIDEIFNLLNRYDVVDSTESYTLLMKKDILEKLLQLSSEVTALSYQGNLNAKYYEKSSGNAASFYAPYGNYAIEVEVTIPEYVVEGDMGYVELWGNNTILSTQNVEVQRQEILQGKKRISMEAASLNNLNSIYVSAFGKNYAFQANLVSIKKVSDTYKPSLSQLCVSGIELHDEMIISDNVKDACISTGILEENVGVKYTYTYLYKAKEPEVSLYLFNTETEKTILKTNKVEKVEDGLYRSQIVVKPSEDRYIAEMILKISSAQDFQLLEVDVKKEYENP